MNKGKSAGRDPGLLGPDLHGLIAAFSLRHEMPLEGAPSLVNSALVLPVGRESSLNRVGKGLVRARGGCGRLGPEDPVRPRLGSP
eukprot:14352918-Alexandrium_andersonii.AAC.1